ncbi:MAG: LuxR C-terminal-related transcriptional regulator [Candidatus Kapabacteria bacterium]|nr:LuxR C-terminal-related transcriptional regulator [Candidatus Kapabacteria bacterium]
MESVGEISFDFLDTLSESIALINPENNKIIYLNKSFDNFLLLLKQPIKIKSLSELIRALNPVNISSLTIFIQSNLNENNVNFIHSFKAVIEKRIVNINLKMFRSEFNNLIYLFFDLSNTNQRKIISLKPEDLVQEYSEIAENNFHWVWEVDEECRYVKSNFAVFDILGYHPDEIIGKTPFELMPKNEAERVIEEFKIIENNKFTITKLINTNISKSGELIKIETYGIPIFDELGRFKGYRGIDFISLNSVKNQTLNKTRVDKTKRNHNFEKKHLLVIDDRRLTSDLLSEAFQDYGQYSINTISSVNANDIYSVLSKYSPDLILYFINFPKFNGLNILKNIVAKYPAIKVVTISECSQPLIIQKIINSDVHGCITVLSSKEELIKCINTVLSGSKYYCENTKEVLSYLFSQNAHSSFSTSFEHLTSRELEILRLIALQMTTTEIAEKLCISKRTAETHRKNLLKKLCVKNSIGLIKLALDNNLIEIN